MFSMKFSFQACSFILFGHLNRFVLPRLLWKFLSNSGSCEISGLLLRSRQCDGVHANALTKGWEHCRALFLRPIRCERWRCMCSWLKSLNLCLRLLRSFLFGFPSLRDPLTLTQKQLQLTWLGSIGCPLTTLNFSFFICKMGIMKPSLWGRC